MISIHRMSIPMLVSEYVKFRDRLIQAQFSEEGWTPSEWEKNTLAAFEQTLRHRGVNPQSIQDTLPEKKHDQ